MSLAGGTRLGHYEVVAPIGAGGMGEVYRAHDDRLRRDVAIKVLPASMRDDPQRLKRFEHEARAAGGLNHPGILSVFDVGEHEGAPYLVTELLDGATLRERLRGGPMPVRKAVEYAVQIAQALAAAHDAGVVHRDLKPDNLFVTKDGRVKILDFGLAKALEASPAAHDATLTADRTDSGGVLGTAGYMAPEQVRGKAVDHRADLFAFGVVLHEMIAGTAPFAKDTPIDRALATLNDDALPLGETRKDVTPALDAIVHRCLEKSPEERFQSARDLAFALKALASTTGSGAGALKAQPERSPLRGGMVLAAGVVAVGIAGYTLGHWLARSAPAAARAPAVAAAKMPTFQRIAFRPGQITRARFSPDGQTIVFGARFTGDEVRVYSASPGGLEPRPLYDRPMDLADVSPTGELALVLGKTFALARAPLAGGEPRILIEQFDQFRGRADASWDPTGENLVVMRQTDGNFRVENPIGTVVLDGLASVGSPRVSPDGSLIAFRTADHPHEFERIEVVDRAGHRRVLLDKLRWVSSIAWHPDGREVWFSDGHRLCAVTLDGAERTLADLPGEITIEEVRRDGRALIIRDDSSRHIVVHRPGDATDRELTWQNGGAFAALSDDGRLMAFGEYALASKSEAYIRPTDGGPAVHLGPGQPQAMSSDGKWLLIVDNLPAHELSLVPTGAGQSRKIAFAPIAEVVGAAFFHDGSRLLLTGHETGKRNRIWVLDLARSTPPQPITPEGVIAAGALEAPTPDGTRMLVADETDETATPSLAPLEGSARIPVPDLDGEPIGWGSDGRAIWLAQKREPVASIASYDLATHVTTKRVQLDGYDLAHNINLNYLYITPDGGTYVTDYVQLSSQLYLVEGLH